MHDISFVFWVILFLYVVLETDALPSWAEFLHLKFLKYEQFKEKQILFGDNLKYKTFISSYYDNFLIKLLTCSECLATWLNIFGFIIARKFLGGWEMFPITTVSSLVGIALLNFIFRKLYE